MFGQLMGVPAGFPRGPEDAAVMDRIPESSFPIGPMVDGAVVDAYRTSAQITEYPFEALQVPTWSCTRPMTRWPPTAPQRQPRRRIPRARLVSLASGGNLQLGQTERVRGEIATFLAS